MEPSIDRPFAQALAKLKGVGLRPTRQRLALTRLLFETGDRHITAEQLPGPCITGLIDLRKTARRVEEGLVIEEGVIPGAVAAVRHAASAKSRRDATSASKLAVAVIALAVALTVANERIAREFLSGRRRGGAAGEEQRGQREAEPHSSTRSMPPWRAFSTNFGIQSSPSKCLAISTTM